jgi:hypothetical protein
MVNVSGPRRLRRYEHRESVGRFAGLNVEIEPDMIRDQEFSELINFNVTNARTLVKRPGFQDWSTTVSSGPSKILAVYDTGTTTPQIVASFETSPLSTLASTDGGLTWTTVVSASRQFLFAVQYNNYLYLVDKNGVARWNGTTLTAISGSPGGCHILEFKDRLWVCDGSPSSNFYFSDPGPAGVETWGVSSVIKIRTGAPGSLVATLPFADRIILFKTMSVWQLFLSGNIASWQLRVLNVERGAISENCVLVFQGLIYMLSWDGVWRSDGSVFKEVSGKVRKYFKQSPLPYRDSKTCLSITNRRLLICYRQISLPLVNTLPQCAYLWYNLDVDAWSEMQLSDQIGKWRPSSIYNWYNAGSLSNLSASLQLVDSWSVDSADTRSIFILSDIPTDKDFPFNSTFTTKFLDFGDTLDMKRCKLFIAELDSSEGAIPSISFGRDNEMGDAKILAGNVIVEGPKAYRMEGPGYFRQLSVTLAEGTEAHLRILTMHFILMLKSLVGTDT